MTKTKRILKFYEFLAAVIDARARHREWRWGQAYFNVLYEEFDPQFANEIRGGMLDPFYDDGRISYFLEAVQRRWS